MYFFKTHDQLAYCYKSYKNAFSFFKCWYQKARKISNPMDFSLFKLEFKKKEDWIEYIFFLKSKLHNVFSKCKLRIQSDLDYGWQKPPCKNTQSFMGNSPTTQQTNKQTDKQTNPELWAGVSPVDDADHAVLTVIGAVDAEFVQQVQQQHTEVTVKLADGGFKTGVRLQSVHLFGWKLTQMREEKKIVNKMWPEHVWAENPSEISKTFVLSFFSASLRVGASSIVPCSRDRRSNLMVCVNRCSDTFIIFQLNRLTI